MCNDLRFKQYLRHVTNALTAVILFSILIFPGWIPALGPETAAADSHYGILDQTAPALNLDEWIDGNGHKTPSIRLTDLRGKIVYLYFFQDW